MDISFLAQPAWSGISLKSTLRLLKLSGQHVRDETDIESSRFYFCVICGRLLDPRFNLDKIRQSIDLCIFVDESTLLDHRKKYEFSKKRQQRGERPPLPVVQNYDAMKRDIAATCNLLLDLLWFWENYESSEFIRLTQKISTLNCRKCLLVDISVKNWDDNHHGYSLT